MLWGATGILPAKMQKKKRLSGKYEKSSFLPFLHSQHLVSVLLPQLGVDALIDAHWVHGESDGQQAVHLLVLFVNLKNIIYKYYDICVNYKTV